MFTVTPYKLTLKVRNNLLIEAMLSSGFRTAAELARAGDRLSPSIVGQYINLKLSALTADGKLRASAEEICRVLGKLPQDVFPDTGELGELLDNEMDVHFSKLEDGDLVLEMGPEELLLADEASIRLYNLLKRVSPLHRRVLAMRHGLMGSPMTTDEVGAALGVSHERARGIEAKALQKLRGEAGRMGWHLH